MNAITTDAALEALLARGCEPLDTPILQPAEPFLDLAGEELRARVLLTDDGAGHLMCLRPEFTIPAARAYLAEGRAGAVRYACAGTVFRIRERGVEFPQGGIEAVGEADAPAADARAVADALAAIRALGHAGPVRVVMGDQAIFEAVTAALGLPATWAHRLSRLFGDEHGLAAALDALTCGGKAAAMPAETGLGAPHALPDDVRAALEAGDAGRLAARIDAAIGDARMRLGARRGTEVAERLLEARALAGTRLGAEAGGALRAFLALECPADEVVERVGALGLGGERGALPAALDRHAARSAALEAAGIAAGEVRFRGAFGRSLDYYTGLTFEIRAAGGGQGGDADRPDDLLAGGGRYDRLMSLLGAPDPVPAIGFALWLDRIGGRR